MMWAVATQRQEVQKLGRAAGAGDNGSDTGPLCSVPPEPRMLFHLFQTLRLEFGFFNVFRYVSTRVGLATLTSLLITFFVAPWFIRRARERQLGEVIRDDGPGHPRQQEGDAHHGRRAHHHGAGARPPSSGATSPAR